MIPSCLIYLSCSQMASFASAPDRMSGGSLNIKVQREKKGRNISRKEGRGWGAFGHFIFSFSAGVMAPFDTETSFCSRPLGLEMSSRRAKWWCLIQISPLCCFISPSPPLPLGTFSPPPPDPTCTPSIRFCRLEMRFWETQFITQCWAWPLLCLWMAATEHSSLYPHTGAGIHAHTHTNPQYSLLKVKTVKMKSSKDDWMWMKEPDKCKDVVSESVWRN